MRLWRVRFGNYEPAEVDSMHASEALADARRDELNVGTFMWEVDSIEVAASPADATLADQHRRMVGLLREGPSGGCYMGGLSDYDRCGTCWHCRSERLLAEIDS